MKKIIFLLAIIVASFSSFASPPFDVGWNDEEKITATNDVAEVQEATDFKIIYAINTEAIVVNPVRYEKRRFVSHDKKYNNKRKQLYGKNKSEVIIPYAFDETLPAVDDDIFKLPWQWLASNTKDQS